MRNQQKNKDSNKEEEDNSKKNLLYLSTAIKLNNIGAILNYFYKNNFFILSFFIYYF
jgi:hypothetical protein